MESTTSDDATSGAKTDQSSKRSSKGHSSSKGSSKAYTSSKGSSKEYSSSKGSSKEYSSSKESSSKGTTSSSKESDKETQKRKELIEKDLRLFVTLLTVRVLSKCRALQKTCHKSWGTHTQQLVDDIVKGVKLTDGVCPEAKHLKPVTEKVVNKLVFQFCGKPMLHSVMILQDPVTDAAITKTMRKSVDKISKKLSEKAKSPCGFLYCP